MTITGLDLGLAKTLNEYFSFYAENYRFHPKYRNGFWNGKIRLFNIKNHTLPIGCWFECYKLLKYQFHQQVKVDPNLKSTTRFVDKKFIEHFIKNTVKQTIEPRNYQLAILEQIFKYQKALVIAPTSAGKTFIISMMLDLTQHLFSNYKALIIVPNVSLIYQMMSDIIDYHEIKDEMKQRIKLIYDIKHDLKNNLILPEGIIVISTWQALQRKQNIPKEFFQQFDILIVDEAHSASAQELNQIVTKCDNAKFKIGLTGTEPDVLARRKQLQALFGFVIKEITTKDLIVQNYISDVEIWVYMLRYTHPKYKKLVKSKNTKKYWLEVDKLSNHPKRIKFIADLLFGLEGVTLYLFKNIENKFSQKLLDAISENIDKFKGKGELIPIYYIDGSTKSSEREAIRQKVIETNKGIIIASFGTFAQGINIPNLQNVVFAEPTKSKVKVLQSIGRALRKSTLKSKAHIIDIVDVIPGKNNYLYRHFKSRLTLYKQEQFPVKLKSKIEIADYFDGVKTNGL